MSHTPGPWTWEADGCEDNFGKGMLLMGGGAYICHLYVEAKAKSRVTTEKWQARRKANARLIASAPELLETCRAVLKQIPESDWVLRSYLENAIAKATGEAQ